MKPFPLKKTVCAAAGLLLGTAGNTSAAKSDRPNILLILTDDMGYSDIGCFGGDAETPVLDSLAENGVRFSRFYNSARCMPTRASLLTGLHPHQAGIGHMGKDFGVDAYRGCLNKNCVTIGEALQPAGYFTAQLGKWHVGNRRNGVMPDLRGFDRCWVREGKVDYFRSDIYEVDGKEWVCPDPDNFYATEEMDRKAIRFIDEAIGQGKPFFIYAAYDAAHWPLHARPEGIAIYRGRFKDRGWDAIRAERYERLKKSGLIPPEWRLPERDPAIPAWKDVEDKDDWDLRMAIYCAQIDAMDRSVGRIVQKLKETGQFENTLIFYLQDNGGCPEWIGRKQKVAPGGADSFQSYRMPWAHVSNTPFQQYKHFVGEGGISTPLIAHWSAGIREPGRICREPGHLIDIMATCVEVSGAQYPAFYNEHKIQPMEGSSLLALLENRPADRPGFLFWEHEGNRAVSRGDWKLLSRYKGSDKFFRNWGFPKKAREQEWELYNLADDRTETEELSEKYPEKVEELKAAYERWARRVGAVDYDELLRGGKGKGAGDE